VSAARDTRALRRSWAPWLPLVLVVALALGIGTFGSTGPATNEERVLAIARTLKCQVCRGESVAESNADSSRAIYSDIAQRVGKGETDDEIRQFYADHYEGILLTPSSSGLTGLVWILPVVALVLSLAGLAVAFRRWSAPEDAHATDDDRALVHAALARRHATAAGDDPADVADPAP